MSDLSVFLHKVAAFFATPEIQSQPGVAQATTAVSQAATAIEGALPSIAKVAGDAALSAAGPIGVASAPLFNDFIDFVVAELQGRKIPGTSPVAALTPAPAPAATMEPIPNPPAQGA